MIYSVWVAFLFFFINMNFLFLYLRERALLQYTGKGLFCLCKIFSRNGLLFILHFSWIFMGGLFSENRIFMHFQTPNIRLDMNAGRERSGCRSIFCDKRKKKQKSVNFLSPWNMIE